MTPDEPAAVLHIANPLAEAVFVRGQRPVMSRVGDFVENDPDAAVAAVAGGWTRLALGDPCWSLVLLDLRFATGMVSHDSSRTVAGVPAGRPEDGDPDHYFGMEILRELRKNFPDLPVIILSSQPSDPQVALRYSDAGALGFLPKDAPDASDNLARYLDRYGLLEDEAGMLLGRSRHFLRALRSARIAARSRHNTLILGESGTGKEYLARYIHRKSSTPDGPLVEVNSAALSEELFQSELFGHVKGAFTSAVSDKKGKMILAEGGDLYMDEIGTLHMRVQEALLRTLQEMRIEPLGSNRSSSVNFRVISATNADMDFLLEAKLFRFDLHERLTRGGIITLPPLRERPEDIPLLAEYFLAEEAAHNDRAAPQHIRSEALQILQGYSWPGNVRELRNLMSRVSTSYADLPYIVSHHVEAFLKKGNGSSSTTLGGFRNTPDVTRLSSPSILQSARESMPPFQELYDYLERFPLDGRGVGELHGQLPRLVEAVLSFISRFLRAALQHYPKRRHPGEYSIEPAFKDIAGDESLTAVDAYDFVKRLFKLWPAAAKSISDPTITRLHDRSRRGRALKQSKPLETTENPKP